MSFKHFLLLPSDLPVPSLFEVSFWFLQHSQIAPPPPPPIIPSLHSLVSFYLIPTLVFLALMREKKNKDNSHTKQEGMWALSTKNTI